MLLVRANADILLFSEPQACMKYDHTGMKRELSGSLHQVTPPQSQSGHSRGGSVVGTLAALPQDPDLVSSI